jgi:ferrous iron transport protein B
LRIDYGTAAEQAIDLVVDAIEGAPELATRFPVRWLSVALVDGDRSAEELIARYPGGAEVAAAAENARQRLETALGDGAVTAIAAARYEWINDAVSQAMERPSTPGPTVTDRVDSVLTNRWLGIPIFLAAMWLVFKLTTDVAAVFLDWIDGAVGGPLSGLVSDLLGAIGLGGTWFESLLIDGVFAGVGAVLTFVPILLLLFVALAILEDTGYMARAAFVMDRVMGGVGLPGKSFLPMLVGFGCTVPAIYATRTLETQRDRVLTGLLVPFMSCGARLPVYVLIATAFFPESAGTAVFLMYLLGIVVALTVGAILRRTVLGGEASPPAILEMPPYRMPTPSSIRFHTWGRTKAFLADAGRIILVTSIVVWALMAIPTGGSGSFADTDVEDSAFAVAAGVVAPALEPLGFGTWEAAGSLMTGFVAKEVVIGTMGQVYGIEGGEAAEPVSDAATLDDLRDLGTSLGTAIFDTVRAIPALVGIDLVGVAGEERSVGLTSRVRTEFETSSRGHGALAGAAFMVFVLLYTPCMAVVAAERRELGTRWMWASVIGQTALAWVVAMLVFQVGKAIGL